MAGGPNEEATLRWLRVVLLVLTTAGGGFGVSQGVDLFNAKAWQEANVEKLMEAERMQDRLLQCRAKVDAYAKQNEMLIGLVNRMQAARSGEDADHGREPGPLPALPRLE